MSEMMLSLTLMTAFFFEESNDDDKAEIPSGLSSDDSSGKYFIFNSMAWKINLTEKNVPHEKCILRKFFFTFFEG